MFRRDYGPGSKPALRYSAQGFGGVKIYRKNPVGWIVSNLGQCIPFLNLAGGEDQNSEDVRTYVDQFPSSGLFLGTNSLANNSTASTGGSPTSTPTAKPGTNRVESAGGTTSANRQFTGNRTSVGWGKNLSNASYPATRKSNPTPGNIIR